MVWAACYEKGARGKVQCAGNALRVKCVVVVCAMRACVCVWESVVVVLETPLRVKCIVVACLASTVNERSAFLTTAFYEIHARHKPCHDARLLRGSFGQ